LYAAHVKREAVLEMRARRDAIVSGAWGNSNLDQEEGQRMKLISAIDDAYEDAVMTIYGGVPAEREVDLKEDPFFSAMKLPELEAPGDEVDVQFGKDMTLAELLKNVEVDQS